MYNAFELTLNRRLAGNWSAIASYRFSQLEGNFEGFFRSDNGQSDPAITSLFDFPTNDPTYTQYSDVHGGAGDIRYQGDSLGTGVLPNDWPHQLKLYGNSYLGQLQPRLRLQCRLGHRADRAGRKSGVRERRGNSLDGTRRGNRHHRRLHDAGLP